MDLFSINYLHFGAPKQWYAISPHHRDKFERLVQEYFAPEYRNCPQFLRHKTSVISPALLTQEHISYNKIIQYPGEFIITFPYGYLQGFNYGFNCAEAVNFALDSWIQKVLNASYCECAADNVRINVLSLLHGNSEAKTSFNGSSDKKRKELSQLDFIKSNEKKKKSVVMLSSKKEGTLENVIPKIRIILVRIRASNYIYLFI